MEENENLFLESLLTKIHDISMYWMLMNVLLLSKTKHKCKAFIIVFNKSHSLTASSFILVNTAHPEFPIVYVSDEFLNFWGYTKKEVRTL